MLSCFAGRRPLDALQVEVTSRCTRSCIVCPRHALAESWESRDLERSTWERLVVDLSVARHLHLQGWGEPLLNRDLPSMVQDAKRAGCSVGITTNGDLLGQAVEWMVELRVDLVSLSVAGRSFAHAKLRDGSSLEDVLEAASGLARKSPTHVKINYLLTRDNAKDLPYIVDIAARLGFRGVVVNHLDTTPTKDLLDRSAFTRIGVADGVAEALLAAESGARKRGIGLWLPATSPRPMLTCALNPLRMAFVGSDGRVGPCVNLLLPISGDIPRVTHKGRIVVKPESWGNLAGSMLVEILESETRRRFVAPFAARLEAEKRFLSANVGEPGPLALERLNAADSEREQALARFAFPDPCAGCHLQQGI